MTGLFVVFEGGDSAGKTTQVRQLASWLASRGERFLLTREPGDSWLGGEIRRLVLDPDSGDISPRAECLLYIADKAQHVVEVVRPALARGEVVVCDRYVDSTIAYQAAGRHLPSDDVETIARWATQSLRPDLTVLLDVDPERAVGRIAQKDRIEAAGDAFHRRVREGFLALAARDPEHYLVLPARDSIDSIATRVRARVEQLLAERAAAAAPEPAAAEASSTSAEPVEASGVPSTGSGTGGVPSTSSGTGVGGSSAEPVEASGAHSTPPEVSEPGGRVEA